MTTPEQQKQRDNLAQVSMMTPEEQKQWDERVHDTCFYVEEGNYEDDFLIAVDSELKELRKKVESQSDSLANQSLYIRILIQEEGTRAEALREALEKYTEGHWRELTYGDGRMVNVLYAEGHEDEWDIAQTAIRDNFPALGKEESK